MIIIKNLRTEKPVYPWQVRVDRESILGNPFPMQKESERDAVCDDYAQYFVEKLKRDEAFKNELRRLYLLHKKYQKLELFCWCTPKRCHAETIRNFLNNYI
jgi:hypothetical protein